MNNAQVKDYLLQALETELGGVRIYEAALSCVRDAALRRQWGAFLTETRDHVEILEEVCSQLGIDSSEQTPARAIVRDFGRSLEQAMRDALARGESGDAAVQLAAECVGLTAMHGREQRRWLRGIEPGASAMHDRGGERSLREPRRRSSPGLAARHRADGA